MTILVTGATGNVGRLVVDELVRAGTERSVPPIRALTVNPVRAALPDGVEVDVDVDARARQFIE